MLNTDLLISLQGVYPKEMGAYILQRMSTKGFIAALLKIAKKKKKTTKELRCPSTGEWINKQCSYNRMLKAIEKIQQLHIKLSTECMVVRDSQLW